MHNIPLVAYLGMLIWLAHSAGLLGRLVVRALRMVRR